MMGAVIKSFFAEREGIDPARDLQRRRSCPARPRSSRPAGRRWPATAVPDVDDVLTTRELAQLIRMFGLDLTAMAPEAADTPFGERTHRRQALRRERRRDGSGGPHGALPADRRGAGRRSRCSRCAGWTASRRSGRRSAGCEIGVAVVCGLGNARKLLEEVRAGRSDLHFIEVMTCPGGCIDGGGQPRSADAGGGPRAHAGALRASTATRPLRASHQNPAVQRLYAEFLEQAAGAPQPRAAAHDVRGEGRGAVRTLRVLTIVD